MKRNKGISQSKNPKTVQCWDSDIICLPHSTSGSLTFSFPRGKYRASLGMKGLIGKIHLSSDMNEDDIKKEIRTIFEVPMGSDPDFPSIFLQTAGEGTKTLVIPSVSPHYSWTAQQVERLAGQRGIVYILAQADMPSVMDKEYVSVSLIKNNCTKYFHSTLDSNCTEYALYKDIRQ